MMDVTMQVMFAAYRAANLAGWPLDGRRAVVQKLPDIREQLSTTADEPLFMARCYGFDIKADPKLPPGKAVIYSSDGREMTVTVESEQFHATK